MIQFTKLLEATFISTLEETSTCCFSMRTVTKVSTDKNFKGYMENSLPFPFTCLFSIANRYAQQDLSAGPQVPYFNWKPFVSTTKKSFPIFCSKSPFDPFLLFKQDITRQQGRFLWSLISLEYKCKLLKALAILVKGLKPL